jgi:hypothetical protein
MSMSSTADEAARDGFLARNRLWISPPLRDALGGVRLAVVGCGGIGMLVAVAAAHVGFRDLALCDPDVLDPTSLNRWPIASSGQVGEPKVKVLAADLAARFPDLRVRPIPLACPNDCLDSVLADPEGQVVVAGCLDTVHARIELDVLCRHRRRTLIDFGAGFVLNDIDGTPLAAGGQVLVSRPEGPCLLCLGFGRVSSHGYLPPEEESGAPSSLLLNSVVAGLGAEALLAELVGELAPVNRISYDRGNLTSQAEERIGREDCSICGPAAGEAVKQVGGQIPRLAGGALCKTL